MTRKESNAPSSSKWQEGLLLSTHARNATQSRYRPPRGGMALMEHTVYDNRDGGTITSNLADYAVPVNADIHSIDVHFIDKPDPYIDPEIGARGIGEITATSAAQSDSDLA
jgi:hypothetical protein